MEASMDGGIAVGLAGTVASTPAPTPHAHSTIEGNDCSIYDSLVETGTHSVTNSRGE